MNQNKNPDDIYHFISVLSTSPCEYYRKEAEVTRFLLCDDAGEMAIKVAESRAERHIIRISMALWRLPFLRWAPNFLIKVIQDGYNYQVRLWIAMALAHQLYQNRDYQTQIEDIIKKETHKTVIYTLREILE